MKERSEVGCSFYIDADNGDFFCIYYKKGGYFEKKFLANKYSKKI